MAKKKKSQKKFTSFHKYTKKIGKRNTVVVLSATSKRMKPHFFRNKRTADRKAEAIRKAGRFAKVEPYKKSYVIYFD